MSNFIGEVELFLKKVLGKIASPTTLFIDERDKWGRELQ